MLKAVVVSDLHGSFPDGLHDAILEEEPDVVVCCGDITPFRLRDEFFEHVYESEEYDSLWAYTGKERYRRAVRKDVADANSVIAALDDLPFPVRFVPGNVDHAVWSFERSEEEEDVSREWSWPDQDFVHDFIKDMAVKDISYGADIIGDYVLIGYPTSADPGEVQTEVYRRHRRWLDNVFRTFEWKKHRDKEVIFVCHNGPNGTGTDLISAEEAPESVRGKHYGSKLARRIVERYQPRICVHGHIDEGRGTDSIGETTVMNVGPGHDGMYGVFEIDNEGRLRTDLYQSS